MPIFGAFPSVDTGVTMLIYIMMALGLNIVVGYAGLLDLGYVAFYAMGAYTAAWFASQHFHQVNAPHRRRRRRTRTRAGDPHLDLARPRHRRDLHGLRRRPHRLPDAAAARRLPRDRHARLRRDHAPDRPQRRPPLRPEHHERPAGHQSDRSAGVREHAARRDRAACRLPDLQHLVPQPHHLERRALLLDRARCSSSSRSSAASACATRGSAARGSRSARTRPPRRRWASR